MTNVPDYRGRIEGNKPQDFFHRVANMIPGYTGYQDKERRREADKELRMFLARRFREQHSELMRVQQQIARSRHLEQISEVDRLGGVLQRFIDKLETATQGYAGLYDAVTIQEAELDQLYTFDAALTGQLQGVTAAIQAVSSAAGQGSGATPAGTPGTAPDLPGALSHLSGMLDDLLRTWNGRNEVIMSGRPLPAAEFDHFRAAAGVAPGATQGGQPGGPQPSGGYGPPPHSGGYTAPPSGGMGGGPAPQSGQPYSPTGPAPSSGQPYSPTGPAPSSGQPYTPTGPAPSSGQPVSPTMGGGSSGSVSEQATGKLPQPGLGSAPPAHDPPGGVTQRLDPLTHADPASDVTGGPTGGPTDSAPR